MVYLRGVTDHHVSSADMLDHIVRLVEDKAAEIEFVSPGRTAVSAEFRLDPDAVAEVRGAADSGVKVLRWFEVDVVGADGAVVARVRKQLYVRRAPAPGERA